MKANAVIKFLSTFILVILSVPAATSENEQVYNFFRTLNFKS